MSLYYQVGGSGGASRSVFIATPAYGGLSAAYVASLAETIPLLVSKGIWPVFAIQSGYCHVDDARNILIGEFLASDCEKMVFIDSDTGWRGKDVLKLIEHDKDFVAGAPPLKRDEVQYAVKVGASELWADDRGLIEVTGVGGAFLCLSRNLLQALFDAEPRKWKETKESKVSALIFERTYEGKQRFSGDYGFCNRVKDAGFKIYVDPEMRFTHVGEKAWSGSWGEWLRHTNNIPLPLDDIDNAYALWDNNYAASPELLKVCVEEARKASRILETGSGLSTLVMAKANPGAEIVAIEHDPAWSAYIKAEIKRQGFTNVTIWDSPLKNHGGYVWYDSAPEGGFDLILCDGPPRGLAHRDALPRFVNTDNATVIMDDVDGGFEVRNGNKS